MFFTLTALMGLYAHGIITNGSDSIKSLPFDNIVNAQASDNLDESIILGCSKRFCEILDSSGLPIGINSIPQDAKVRIFNTIPQLYSITYKEDLYIVDRSQTLHNLPKNILGRYEEIDSSSLCYTRYIDTIIRKRFVRLRLPECYDVRKKKIRQRKEQTDYSLFTYGVSVGAGSQRIGAIYKNGKIAINGVYGCKGYLLADNTPQITCCNKRSFLSDCSEEAKNDYDQNLHKLTKIYGRRIDKYYDYELKVRASTFGTSEYNLFKRDSLLYTFKEPTSYYFDIESKGFCWTSDDVSSSEFNITCIDLSDPTHETRHKIWNHTSDKKSVYFSNYKGRILLLNRNGYVYAQEEDAFKQSRTIVETDEDELRNIVEDSRLENSEHYVIGNKLLEINAADTPNDEDDEHFEAKKMIIRNLGTGEIVGNVENFTCNPFANCMIKIKENMFFGVK